MEVKHFKTLFVYFLSLICYFIHVFLVHFAKDCKFYPIAIQSHSIDRKGVVFFVTLWEKQIAVMTNGNLGAESTLCAYMDQIADAGEQTRDRDLHRFGKGHKKAKAEVKAINDQCLKELAQGSTFNTTYNIVL